MKLLIAIPALNEEQSIRSTIQRCLEATPGILGNSPVTDVEVTVISDGSTDRTVERAREFGSLINLIEFTRNQGYGAAIMGAWSGSEADLLGFLDADGTCDPARGREDVASAPSGEYWQCTTARTRKVLLHPTNEWSQYWWYVTYDWQ